MSFDRRRFLKWSALGLSIGAGAYTGGWWWAVGREGDTRALILSILRRHVAPMRPREEDLAAFADEIRPRFTARRKLAMFGMLAPVYERLDFTSLVPVIADRLEHFEDEIVAEFLFSTNAFTDWPGEPTPIRYDGWRGPGPHICANPFAVFDEE